MDLRGNFWSLREPRDIRRFIKSGKLPVKASGVTERTMQLPINNYLHTGAPKNIMLWSNPTLEQINTIVWRSRYNEARLLITPTRMYAWDADEAIHDAVAHELQLNLQETIPAAIHKLPMENNHFSFSIGDDLMLGKLMRREAEEAKIKEAIQNPIFRRCFRGATLFPISGWKTSRTPILIEALVKIPVEDGWGHDWEISVISNPSSEQLITIANRDEYGHVRFLANQQDIFVWPANDLMHQEVQQYLQDENTIGTVTAAGILEWNGKRFRLDRTREGGYQRYMNLEPFRKMFRNVKLQRPKIEEATSSEDEEEHFNALAQTGYYGRAGAGAIIMAKSTGRILLPLRSQYVEQPGTWGVWGGAIDRGEDPAKAVRREVAEERGLPENQFGLIPLYVFQDKGFRYSNFLAIVPEEFNPKLNWETQRATWLKVGQWPSPLHFGLKALLSDPKSAEIIQREAGGQR